MENKMENHTAGPPSLIIRDGEVYADSRDVAAYFGKAHKHVLEKIRGAPCSVEFQRSNFRPIKIRDLTCASTSYVEMTKDGFAFVVLGFTGAKAGQFKEQYISQFNAMEATLRRGLALPVQPAIPTTFVEALRLAANEAEARIEAETGRALAVAEVKRLKPMALIGERAAPFERTLKRVMQTFPGVNITIPPFLSLHSALSCVHGKTRQSDSWFRYRPGSGGTVSGALKEASGGR